jgi:hypothetical protein
VVIMNKPMKMKTITKKPMKMKTITEKMTGEKYASKSAMRKHEKAEGPAMRKKEYGSKMKRGMR